MSLQINAADLLQRLKNGETPIMIDVREVIEYHTYNIGGVNMPLSGLADTLTDLDYNKTDEIIVICRAGIRSRTAQKLLEQQGYQNVKNLTGGLVAVQKLK